MKKKILYVLFILISVFAFTACKNNKKDNEKALEFKEDYESLNGVLNANKKEHRTITLSENNKFVEITEEELLKKIENKETFYMYFGSTLCPWCRSVIEIADQISRDNNIEAVYYLDIWDDEGKEIFRDAYVLDENNKPKLYSEGTEGYKKLIEILDSLLSDYTLKDDKGNKIEVGEKRIYAPNFVYFIEGTPMKLVTGISSKQTDSRGELTEEIIEEETQIFEKFFTNICNADANC